MSKEFKDLFEKMVCPKPKERISLCQIKKHSWLQEIVKFYEDYSEIKEKIEMSKKFDKKKQSSPKKNSIKYLSYNPSFNKEEKKCLQNEKLDNVSNHSDDINQKKRIKNKSLNFYSNENKKNIIIVKNSLQKEFENKYLKELSSRKLIIDKILKEQEDDGD